MKNEYIKVRVSEKEKEEIINYAKQVGLDTSKYLRKVALSKENIKVIDFENIEQVENSIGDISYQIAKLGNNVNQIAHRINAGHSIPETTIHSLISVLERLNARLKRIEESLYKIYD